MGSGACRKTDGRKRPIALEKARDSPDDRGRLSTEDPHPEGMGFDEAIDSLLSETDPVRAEDDSTDEPYNPEAVLEEQSDPKELGDAAFDAIDSVEQNAQSLLEDAIESLLDEHDASEVEDEPTPDDSISTDELNAQLDALETPGAEERTLDKDLDALSQSVDELEPHDEQPGDPEPNDASEIEEEDAITAEESADAPVDQVDGGVIQDDPAPAVDATDSLSDDDLINSIAADLMETEASEPAQEESVSELEPEASGDEFDETSPEQSVGVESDDSALESEVLADDTEPESAIEEDPFADAIDQLVESTAEIDAAPTGSSEVDETETEPVSESNESDTGSDSVLEDASTLADLDATLAGIGDDLLMGDFESPDGELIGSEDLGISDASSLLDMLNMGDLDLNSDTIANAAKISEPSTQVSAPADHTPSPTPQAEQPPQQPKPATGPIAHSKLNPKPIASTPLASMSDAIDDSPIPEVESIWQSTRRIAIHAGQLAWFEARTRGIPLGEKALVLVNKPFRDRPAIVRDSIGYLAMWTGLLATILWVYLAFIRETPTPTPTQAPSRMLEPGEVIDPLRNASVDP